MQLWTRSAICRQCRRTMASHARQFSEGDIVLLRPKIEPYSSGKLTKPLSASGTVATHRGVISHSSIINRRARDLVPTSTGMEYRLYEPTLSEYVCLTPRIVTPIYPADANLIVSLLDLHVQGQRPESAEPLGRLEILEAGTGHGGLTLHLARAIHAANTAPPARFRRPIEAEERSSESSGVDDSDDALVEKKELETWRKSRSAVVHSLDISAKHSKHAAKVVKGFRRGMYAGNVDFHVGDVSDWIREQFSTRTSSSPFLSHVLLDLPSAETHLEQVAQALKVDGVLTVFNPSITQIAGCLQAAKQKGLPLQLDQVIEMGQGFTSGRQWDVRAVKPRALQRMQEQANKPPEHPTTEPITPTDDAEGNSVDGGREDESSQASDDGATPAKPDDGWTLVCRPKVGDRIIGGGFLGLWKRMRI